MTLSALRRVTADTPNDKPKKCAAGNRTRMLLNFVAHGVDQLVIQVDVDLVIAGRK